MTLFLIRSIGALGSGGVEAIQDRPQYQHITTGAPWMGEVDLLHDDYGVLCVTLQ